MRFVCVFRVLVCARVSHVCVPAPPVSGVFLSLFSSCLVCILVLPGVFLLIGMVCVLLMGFLGVPPPTPHLMPDTIPP